MSNNNSSGGIGFVGVLTVVFIVLKLCGVIEWSWWWVLAPAWIATSVVLMIVTVCGILYWLLKDK